MLRANPRGLLSRTSAIALTSAALVMPTMIDMAKATTVPTAEAGIFAGGGTLASQAIRQIMDCYGNHVADDGFTTSATFRSNPPTPGSLPSACSQPVIGKDLFEGLYAGTGSGRGRQAFIAHDARQLWEGSGTTTAACPTGTVCFHPETLPPPIDHGADNTVYKHYPYPSTLLAFANSDAALSTLSNNKIDGTATTYNDAAWGPANQVPLLETPVTLPINVDGLDNLKQATPTGGNSKVQLSAADVCAIFSGTVTDWNSTDAIAAYDGKGNAGSTVKFDQDNNPAWRTSSASTPFAKKSTPIKVVYRSDGSGTTSIFTNWLHTVCAPLDDGKNNYAGIFRGSVSTFTDLFTKATPVLNVPGTFVPAAGSQEVALNVNTSTAHPGAIGYLSPDFTKKYSKLTYAPVVAAVQNASLRNAGYLHAASSKSFIEPTPASVDLGIAAVKPPGATATWHDWDLTSQTVDPAATGAYPIAGVTYIEFYSCYAAGTAARDTGSLNNRYLALVDFLSWYYPTNGTANATVRYVLQNNGFHELSKTLALAVHNEYLKTGVSSKIGQPGSKATTACPSGAKGA